MPKRKFKQNHLTSDDEMESQRPVKQLNKRNSTTTINMPSTSREYDSIMDNDNSCSTETSNVAEIGDTFESFTSFLKAFSFKVDSDDDDDENKKLVSSRNASSECKNSRNDCGRSGSKIKVARPSASSLENSLDTNIRIFSVPSKLSELVVFDPPASVTLHGYVEVSVWFGKVSIFGYKLKEGKSIKVFSTEGTGLKKAVALKSAHKSTLKALKSNIEELTCFQRNIEVKELLDSIGSETVILKVQKIASSPPLRFLELYYPNALQTRWPKSGKVQNKNNFELCSTKEAYAIDISEDFEILSEELDEIMSQPVSDEEEFGPRIIVTGEQKLGKSTLIRYLMNSALNKHPVFYFLDTDLGQTEYTPSGVVSVYRVTKPLLGPPFAHQKKALKMLYVGSLSPAASPELFKTSIMCLMKYFNYNFPKETLFVNTMGWCKGLGELCLQDIRDIVKPTVVIRLVPPEPNLSLEKEVNEDKVIFFYIPSKARSLESGAPSYNAKELRDFNLTAYFGQMQKPYLRPSRINSFRPFVVNWYKVALYVMWNKTPPERLIESFHGSVVALCSVDLSYILESDDPDLPLTLSENPICECLGFGIVRASDETNRLFYVITPLKDELKKVNALVKGDMAIPANLFIKQNIPDTNLPFTDSSQEAKHPGLKPVLKRAFRNTLTPLKKP